ncbi:response regulator transcription factor [Paenibacillus sinopodophylli]|uniref:response regulator transcription factor n=1 Tax=Paenibacillus sinopodophylli TaxID=1837342 RepID=UPI001486A763|nr:response regulator transcription factor [Paenibacillus sinopodophylli]
MNSDKILIVDDEPEIRQLIRIHVEHAGMEAFEAESGHEAIAQLKGAPFSLMILDLMMDDQNGFEVLHYLRENEMELLVIVLSARRNEEDKITALGLGAVDFVTKPFSPLELIARLQTNLRRLRPKAHLNTAVIQLNNLKLDVDNLLLVNHGESYTLTQMECELLQLFMRNPDRVLTKREIYQQIWNHENYDDNTLSVFMNRLRKKIEPLPSSPHYIHTIRSVGYRFSGDGL